MGWWDLFLRLSTVIWPMTYKKMKRRNENGL